ncbi:unnamed protein product [Cuscuta epithymum]|uniref:Uncharacterized protein n=1 Tax=Cuscuta epithymum TaxID=186058 RepID=A0AAV0C6J3_9ASTE|nr:unnamed protein product [Cuscuta epithymum]
MDFSGFVNENIIDTTVDVFFGLNGLKQAVVVVVGDIPVAGEVEREPAAAAELDGEAAATAMDDVPELDGEIHQNERDVDSIKAPDDCG